MQYLILPNEKHFHLHLLYLKHGAKEVALVEPVHVSSTPILKLSHPIQHNDQLVQVTTKLYPGIIPSGTDVELAGIMDIGEGVSVTCQCAIWLLEHEQATKDNQLIVYQSILSFVEGLELLSSGKVLRSTG